MQKLVLQHEATANQLQSPASAKDMAGQRFRCAHGNLRDCLTKNRSQDLYLAAVVRGESNPVRIDVTNFPGLDPRFVQRGSNRKNRLLQLRFKGHHVVCVR